MIAAAAWLLSHWRALLAGALVAACTVQTLRIADLKQDAAELRATDAENQRLAMKAQRDEFDRRQGVMDLEATRAQTQFAALEGDLDDVRSTADGLQRAAELAAGVARRRAQPGAAVAPVDGGDPIGVLTFVLGRAGARSEIVERLADERGIRAAGCERAYDGLQLVGR